MLRLLIKLKEAFEIQDRNNQKFLKMIEELEKRIEYLENILDFKYK